MSEILLVEDDFGVAIKTQADLQSLGHEIDPASTIDQAANNLNGDHYDLIIIDYSMTVDAAVDLLALADGKGLPVIVASGHRRPVTLPDRYSFLQKPIDADEWRDAIENLGKISAGGSL